MQMPAAAFVSAGSVSSVVTTTEAVISELPKDDGPAFPLGDGRYSQLKRSHLNFASSPYQRSQQSKGHMEIYLWTEWKSRAPMFSAKMTRKTLRVESWSNPAWLKARLKFITRGRLQSRARDCSQETAQGNDSRHMRSAGTTSEAIAVLKNRLQRGISTDSYTVC